ncbi:hypothetical protein PIB30_094891 [Stylosanthes scabra]|uniref:Reverse transcriptase domain-containing protein n=1 Tax=Stylosanthes scabra TaxID=79078 RepID=A0ABU6XY21_9FABA|nr:hypothetical protein [Stylosanthes scabra]
MLNFFENIELPKDAKLTWVSLALKEGGINDLKDFRPISMVGCQYKKTRRLAWVMKLDFQKAYDIVKEKFVDIYGFVEDGVWQEVERVDQLLPRYINVNFSEWNSY